MGQEIPKRQTKVIAIGNQKGGVAKSTTATHLAAAFAELGRKSLIWDLDGNSGTTQSFLIPPTFLGSYEVMIGEERPEDVILSNDPEVGISLPVGVDVIIARRNIENLDETLRSHNRFADGRDSLLTPLQQLEGKYDYVFLDTAPNTNPPTMAAYKAAKWFILTATPDPLAIQGLNEAMEDIKAVREHGNANLRLLGVVLSCVDRRTRLAMQLTSFVKESFPANSGTFETEISRAVAIPEAQGVGKTIFQTEPSHKVAEEYRKLAREVEARIHMLEAEEAGFMEVANA